jgi:hypothetical protein
MPQPLKVPPTTGVLGFCENEKLGDPLKVWVPDTVTVIVAFVTVRLNPTASVLLECVESEGA